MRIGSTVLLYNGYCYQSYNWNMLRPLGKLQHIIDSLESYECDEVSIVRPVREENSFDAFIKDINEIKKLNCMTPLSFGGGLRSKESIDLLHDLPIERLIFSSEVIDKNFELISYAQKLFGHQAIQTLIPFMKKNNEYFIFNSKLNKFIAFKNIDLSFIIDNSNEIVLYDVLNEGSTNNFDESLLNILNIPTNKLLISGGIGERTIKSVKNKGIAATLIENRVLHNEFSIKEYRSGK